jgi:hypothetical protein
MRNIDPQPPKDKKLKPETSRYDKLQSPDRGREGGDDALQSAPDDARLDEKVIVNAQESDKVVNTGEDPGHTEEM